MHQATLLYHIKKVKCGTRFMTSTTLPLLLLKRRVHSATLLIKFQDWWFLCTNYLHVYC